VAAVELACPTAPNDTGAYRLAWQGPEGAVYRLTETAGEAPRTLYEGPDLATTVTGRTAGLYTYRLETLSPAAGPDAASCVVEVAPPPLALAFGLFGVGLALCLATISLIVRGHRRHRRGELG
jgi:hypothetical protein